MESSSQYYDIQLSSNCPSISNSCVFSLSSNSTQDSINMIHEQCTQKCALEWKEAIVCNESSISQLLIRIYNAKCVSIDGILCWVELLQGLETKNNDPSCSICNKKLMEKEDQLARYLETEFGTKRRQISFMKYQRQYFDPHCPNLVQYGLQKDQNVLEGYGAVYNNPFLSTYGYFLILVFILLAGLIALIALNIKRTRSKSKAFDAQNDSKIDDTSDETTHSFAKLEELQFTPNINRLSQYSVQSPICPIDINEVDFWDSESTPSRFSSALE
eukprot:NODE_288_length_11703_cov_0.386591.p4 type:complete len:273 gc:universal NODE_288_length_11703_cov_0.386591:11494-10676(-)